MGKHIKYSPSVCAPEVTRSGEGGLRAIRREREREREKKKWIVIVKKDKFPSSEKH